MSGGWKNPMLLYYAGNWCWRHHIPVLPSLCEGMLYLLTTAVVPSRTNIGPGCRLGHGGSGVVIHYGSVIGRNVLINQQVTLGGTGKESPPRLPVIGDDVYVGAGAKIIGPVEVGSNSVIGANAVVTKSVPAGCVAAGVPARIVREGIDAHDIEDF